MVADEQPECGPIQPCAQDDSDVWLRQVQPGEPAALVAAYQEAIAVAAYVRIAVEQAGLRPTDVVVIPSLTDAGRPVARLVLTPAGRRRLGSLRLSRGSGPYPLTA